MPQMTHHAHAKINLGLTVFPRRPDGYHNLKTVMVRLRLSDTVTMAWDDSHVIDRSGPAITITSSDPGLPLDHRNLAYKALLEYSRHLSNLGLSYLLPGRIDVHLEKSIPAGAGMGGGSSDAATTLTLINQVVRERLKSQPRSDPGVSGVYATNVSLPELAAHVGSDVPFFLGATACLAEGRGEVLRPLRVKTNLTVVCAMPEGTLLTRDVYELFDVLNSTGAGSIDAVSLADAASLVDVVCRALESGQPHLLRDSVANDLEPAAFRLLPAVQSIKQFMRELNPICSSMTGSGSCVYGLFADHFSASQALERLKSHPQVRWCGLTETMNEVFQHGSCHV